MGLLTHRVAYGITTLKPFYTNSQLLVVLDSAGIRNSDL